MIAAPTAPGSPAATATTGTVTAVGSTMAGFAVVLTIVGAALIDGPVGGHGLIGALPPWYWLGMALAVGATGWLTYAALLGAPQVAALVPALWLAVLHTAPALAGGAPAHPSVHANLGLAAQVGSGVADGRADPRLAWPGFHAAAAPAVTGADPLVLDWVLRLWPTLIIGVSAALVAALARRAYPNRALVGPLAALFFVLGSWTGIGPFTPLSAAFVAYLAAIVVLEVGPLRPRGSWSSVAPVLSRFGAAGGDRPEARSSASAVALLILVLATVVTHPVVPLALSGALVVLAVYGRRVAWYLALVGLVGAVVWMLVVGEPWWSSSFGPTVTQLGIDGLGLGVEPSPGAAASSAHRLVGAIRTWLAVVILISTLVVVALLTTERCRPLRPSVPLALVGLVPFLMVAALRGPPNLITEGLPFLLPATAILLARMATTLSPRLVSLVVAAVVAVTGPLFLVARHGHDAYQQVTAADRTAVAAARATADASTLVVADNRALPWTGAERSDGADRSEQGSSRWGPVLIRAEPTSVWLQSLQAEASAGGHERIVVVLTGGQSAWREQAEGQPAGSLDQVGRWLGDRPGVEVLHHGDGTWVIEIEPDR